jgi:type I restriction enzyme R subunit
VPPHPERRPAQGHEGAAAECALFIGFTGTPLLKADKARSIEVFGRYIHTYKFDRRCARAWCSTCATRRATSTSTLITSQKKIDEWFEAKTKGLNDLAKAQLKQKWGTMQRCCPASRGYREDRGRHPAGHGTRPRLMDGHGNAMLVAGSIYEACKFYELFAKTELKGKCAIVTSYMPTTADAKGEATGEGETTTCASTGLPADAGRLVQRAEDVADGKVELFEKQAKKRFIERARPDEAADRGRQAAHRLRRAPATYLYIDKKMQRPRPVPGHLPREPPGRRRQGIRLHHRLQGSVQAARRRRARLHQRRARRLRQGRREGLLEDRLHKGRKTWKKPARRSRRCASRCAAAGIPCLPALLLRGGVRQCRAAEGQRAQAAEAVQVCGAPAARLRALASELEGAGYTAPTRSSTIKAEVDHFARCATKCKLASGDYIDLKAYEPAMRS